MKRAYERIQAQGFTAKPRETGLTMAIDWGVPVTLQADYLRMAGDYVDLAKIAVGINRLYREEYLRQKIAVYQEHGVEPFPGGMFLEYASCHGQQREYLEDTVALGYRLIEVSDNNYEFPGQGKYELIRRCVEDYGLRVLGEVGRKYEATDVSAMIRDIHRCLEAGSWKVFVEAAEFFSHGQFRADVVQAIAAEVPMDRLIFELPGKWIKEIHAHQIHTLKVWLIDHLGAAVNIGNVFPEDLLVLQSLRTRLGVNTLLPGKE